MRNRPFYKPLLGLLAVFLLFVSSSAQRELNGDRARMGLLRGQPLGENAPPVLVFTTVALGGFRGLIANVLWVRANDLQQDEKYFEMVQLADWITKLEPHFTTVWIHQAWNMSYNISVKFIDFNDRWTWVRRGIELLRDEGLKYNPQEALIYRELAWHYQHKMGNNLDSAHMVYKAEWANEMTQVIGDRHTPDWDELLNPKTEEAKARVKLLREKYKLDPAKMKEVDGRHGPLEWRLPEAHAIYWAYLGLQRAKPKDLITLRRVIYQSLDLASKRGRLVENKADQYFEFGPNTEVIPKANAAYEQMIAEDKEFRENIIQAHRSFLRHAVSSYYTYNREKEALQLFNYALKTYKYDDLFYKKNFEDFVLDYLTEEANQGGVDRARLIIEGFLEQEFYSLAVDEDDRAAGFELLARKLWNRHQDKVKSSDRGRVDLPEFAEIRRDVLNTLTDPEKSPYSQQLVNQLRTKLRLPAIVVPPPLIAAPKVKGSNLPPRKYVPMPAPAVTNLTNTTSGPVSTPKFKSAATADYSSTNTIPQLLTPKER